MQGFFMLDWMRMTWVSAELWYCADIWSIAFLHLLIVSSAFNGAGFLLNCSVRKKEKLLLKHFHTVDLLSHAQNLRALAVIWKNWAIGLYNLPRQRSTAVSVWQCWHVTACFVPWLTCNLSVEYTAAVHYKWYAAFIIYRRRCCLFDPERKVHLTCLSVLSD